MVKTSFYTEVQVTWLKPGLVFRLIRGLSLQLRPAMKLVIIDGATHGGERAMSLFKDYDPDESQDLLHY